MIREPASCTRVLEVVVEEPSHLVCDKAVVLGHDLLPCLQVFKNDVIAQSLAVGTSVLCPKSFLAGSKSLILFDEVLR